MKQMTCLLVFGIILNVSANDQKGWFMQNSGTKNGLTAVYFIDADTGWVVGRNGTILNTTDSGANWIPQTSGTEYHLSSVYLIDSKTGWAVGGSATTGTGSAGIILKTSNGGISWISQYKGVYHLYSVNFIDANTGWAVGINGTILQTTDGGANWISQTSGTSNTLVSVYFIDDNTGWVVGWNGTILKTTDGGANWISQNEGTIKYLMSVYFIDDNTGWVVGENGKILKTTAGGTNWISQNSKTSEYLSSIYFIDDNTGWVVGWNGTILKTTDGGANWISQNEGTIEYLMSVFFVDANIGWAVGGNGAILHTTTGGENGGIHGKIIHVPADHPTIQAAIDVAMDGDTVLVHPGTYLENINYYGKSIVVGSLFLTIGDTSYISQTVIDGNEKGKVVTFENYENSEAVLSGFTITNGDGIYCNYASPRLANLIVSRNYGRGIHCAYSSSILKNLTVSENFDGGIYLQDTNSSLENVIIRNNTTNGRGGGLYCNMSYPSFSLKNVIISGNEATQGGGIWCFISEMNLINVTISDNTASESGGGIYCDESVQNIINTILWNNIPHEICYYDVTPYPIGGKINITYSDVKGGRAGIVTNDSRRINWLEGNITFDPLFIDAQNNDFHLQSGSPCIDAGNPDPKYNDPENPDDPGYALYPAMGTIRNDIGAFGGPLAADYPRGPLEIILAIPSINAFPGDTVLLPIEVQFPYPKTYGSAELSFGCYQSGLKFMEIDATSSLIGEAGWIHVACETDSLLKTAYRGTQTISGSGTFCYLKFQVSGDDGTFVPIRIKSALFNSGEDSVRITDGGVQINPLPDLAKSLMIGNKFFITAFAHPDLGEPQLIYESVETVLGDTTIEDNKYAIIDIVRTDSKRYQRYERSDFTRLYEYKDNKEIVVYDFDWPAGKFGFKTITKGTAEIFGANKRFIRIDEELSEVTTNIWIYYQTFGFQYFQSGGMGSYTVIKLEGAVIDGVIYGTVNEVDSENGVLPVKFNLSQNYPNPFNSVTSIKYSIPTLMKVSLVIYNSLGETIKILVQEIQSAGDYQILFDANELASGVYFYQLKAGNFQKTLKLLFLK